MHLRNFDLFSFFKNHAKEFGIDSKFPTVPDTPEYQAFANVLARASRDFKKQTFSDYVTLVRRAKSEGMALGAVTLGMLVRGAKNHLAKDLRNGTSRDVANEVMHILTTPEQPTIATEWKPYLDSIFQPWWFEDFNTQELLAVIERFEATADTPQRELVPLKFVINPSWNSWNEAKTDAPAMKACLARQNVPGELLDRLLLLSNHQHPWSYSINDMMIMDGCLTWKNPGPTQMAILPMMHQRHIESTAAQKNPEVYAFYLEHKDMFQHLDVNEVKEQGMMLYHLWNSRMHDVSNESEMHTLFESELQLS